MRGVLYQTPEKHDGRYRSERPNATPAPLSAAALSMEFVNVPPKIPTPQDDPISTYRTEKARRAERLQQSEALFAAKAEFQRQLDAQRAAGKGGRPKGSKNGAPHDLSRPSRPHFLARRCEPGDELIVALGRYQGRSA